MQNETIYEGKFKYGKANGHGTLKSADYIYTGYFKDDLKHGEGE